MQDSALRSTLETEGTVVGLARGKAGQCLTRSGRSLDKIMGRIGRRTLWTSSRSSTTMWRMRVNYAVASDTA